jgi:lysozyme family protein
VASFEIAYRKYILPQEGGYSNVPQDKGGETYAGIARNFHPSWPGWTYIDFVKKSTGKPIDRNKKFPDIQYQVDAFYLDWWNKKRFSEIKSQELANLLFDYNVNSDSLAIKAVQRLVNVTPDGVMGPGTVAAINSTDPTKLHDALLAERKQLYEKIMARDPSQEVFRNGWMARIASFPTLGTTATVSLLGLVIGTTLLMLFLKPKLMTTQG